MPSSVQETMKSINQDCRSKGGKYAGYSCKVVSWDDVSRGTVGGSLSCWGANITDTYLKSKDGTQLFTVRPDNWNEKLGRVSSAEVALVAGNHVPGGSALAPQTLRSFLENLGEYGSYAGLSPVVDFSKDLDKECSIRFQTTFLPVEGHRGSMEFATEAYNYNTLTDSDPRNLVLLCTSQGVAVQQDGQGAKRLLHHAVDKRSSIHRYWLEAERSSHKVGGPQCESEQERNDALARGKATATVIGTRAMGTRFNVLMTIQVPLQQQKKPRRPKGGLGSGVPAAFESDESDAAFFESVNSQLKNMLRVPFSGAMQRGTANAARVSRGSEYDIWSGLSISQPKRNDSEHVTVTVVIYNTVADGVPTEEDVVAAIDDLEDLYAKCGANGKLAESTFAFMKEKLTINNVMDIFSKTQKQPYKPPAVPAKNRCLPCFSF
mmetsp:Transcript_44161/g.79437  ORF Transcript_44161/g.79437 Transcript_44161/m.79437 type:complete len:434 (+) Transcript_44161:82-1383(+)